MTVRTAWIILFVTCSLSGAVVWSAADLRFPGNDEGYAPVQPIAFSHRLHAGELAIDCLYCHSGAERSRHAGIPSLTTCMNCHRTVPAPMADVRAEAALAEAEGREPRPIVSDEIQKIYAGLGLGPKLERDPAKPAKGVAWTKVYDLPDFAYFHHGRHLSAGVACETCHGPVRTMERLRQVGDLSMGWCVNCHRQSNESGAAADQHIHASTDCAGCHY